MEAIRAIVVPETMITLRLSEVKEQERKYARAIRLIRLFSKRELSKKHILAQNFLKELGETEKC